MFFPSHLAHRERDVIPDELRCGTASSTPRVWETYGSSLNDVVKALAEGFQRLEQGCKLRINGEVIMVWAPILAFTGDMKSQ